MPAPCARKGGNGAMPVPERVRRCLHPALLAMKNDLRSAALQQINRHFASRLCRLPGGPKYGAHAIGQGDAAVNTQTQRVA